MLPVITISREFGSGGHSVGEAVAKKLGIPFYDSEIVKEAVKNSGLAESVIEEKGEYSSLWDRIFMNPFTATPEGSYQDRLFKIQAEIILEAANKGPCVIVGRCGDYILEKNGVDVLKVFIHANEEYRKKRIMLRYGENGFEIEDRLKKKDKERKAYYKFYTDRNWGDVKNYDLSLSTSGLGDQFCIEAICAAAKDMDK